MKNYPDWFAAVGKTMVKKSDGSFILVNDDELLALKRENKVGVENAKTMGGKVMDLTQKPILVLKE
jgi:restriction endonuclease Mrr